MGMTTVRPGASGFLSRDKYLLSGAERNLPKETERLRAFNISFNLTAEALNEMFIAAQQWNLFKPPAIRASAITMRRPNGTAELRLCSLKLSIPIGVKKKDKICGPVGHRSVEKLTFLLKKSGMRVMNQGSIETRATLGLSAPVREAVCSPWRTPRDSNTG